MLTDLLYPPDTGNILCGTLNFAVLHVNFPGYPPDIKILPPPPGEVPAEPTEGGIPPRRTGEVPRFARQRGIRPARGKHKHFKRNNPRAPDTMIHPPPGSRELRGKEFPRNFTRAPAIKNNRFPLHKHSVSTSPFLLTPAFPRLSHSAKRAHSPAPTFLPSRGGGYPHTGRTQFSRPASAKTMRFRETPNAPPP